KGLVAMRARFLWNGFIPFFRICEFGIYVENNPTEREQAVLDDLSNLKFRVLYLRHTHSTLFSSPPDKLKSTETSKSFSSMFRMIGRLANWTVFRRLCVEGAAISEEDARNRCRDEAPRA